jgi:hypothetical protein
MSVEIAGLFFPGREMKIQFALLCLLLLLNDRVWGQTDDDLLKKRFLSEYRGAIDLWEARFSTAEGVVRFTSDDSSQKDSPHRVIVYSFKCKLPDMARVIESSDTDGASEQRVLGYNKSTSFVLKRKRGRKEYYIESVDARGSDRPPVALPLKTYLRAPYATDISLLSIVSSPHFSIRAASRVSRDGRDLVRIAFDCPTDPPANPRKGFVDFGGLEGSILVSPSEKWVLYEYDCRSKKGMPMSFKGTVGYEGVLDGFPIPRRVTREKWMKHPKGEFTESQVYEFLDFRFGSPSDEEFTLAAFSIPDVARPSTRSTRSVGLGYWFFALAVVSLAGAVLFKIASSGFRGGPVPQS